jgi:hypothetical protein
MDRAIGSGLRPAPESRCEPVQGAGSGAIVSIYIGQDVMATLNYEDLMKS